MLKEGRSDIAKVLERIRARLRTQIEADLCGGDEAAPAAESPSVNIERLRQQLAEIRSAHQRVGVVNPRNAGLINDLVQMFKKFLRRILSWYTRPIVEFQARSTEFFDETAEILGREQARVAKLEKEMEALTVDLADLRQQLQSRLEDISGSLDGIERDDEPMRIGR